MTTENVKIALEEKTNISQKKWKRVSKKTFPNGDELRIFEDKETGLIFETIEHEGGHIQLKCINGNFHDPILDKAILGYEDLELEELTYSVVSDNNQFFLVPLDPSDIPNNPIFGPFSSLGEAAGYYQADIEVIHYPQQLCFDLKMSSDYPNTVEIYLSSLIDEGYDNLGGHNVNGLPYNLSSEDMENTWSIEDKTLAQVKKDMIDCGFTYCKFL